MTGNYNQQMTNNNYNQQMANNNFNQPAKKSNSFGKVFGIIAIIVAGIVILFVVIFSLVSANSNKLICKSNEGDITLMYNDSAITGYSTVGMSYDMDQQNTIASRVGIDNYISQFKTWFEKKTSGTCTIKKK